LVRLNCILSQRQSIEMLYDHKAPSIAQFVKSLHCFPRYTALWVALLYVSNSLLDKQCIVYKTPSIVHFLAAGSNLLAVTLILQAEKAVHCFADSYNTSSS